VEDTDGSVFSRLQSESSGHTQVVRKSLAHVVLIIPLATQSYAFQEKSPSPTASASCKFVDGGLIVTKYSSLRMKGRKIFGGLVPYGQVWRMGADQAPKLLTDTDLSVGDKEIPAGTYTLFTVPASDKWTLIINKKAGEPGTPYPPGEDLLRVDMNVSKTELPVENFTIAFQPKDGICSLILSWEHTQAKVDLKEKKLCWPTTSPLTYSCPDQ
jgi:hypothetical protein